MTLRKIRCPIFHRTPFMKLSTCAAIVKLSAAMATSRWPRLGIIAGQVSHDSVRASGVGEHQIAIFEHQADAIEAVRSGEIDAYASTALGNRILADRIGGSVLQAVEHKPGTNGKHQRLPSGAFPFNRGNVELLNAVDAQLRSYFGSPDHRDRMAKFGMTHNEIDPVLAR